MEKHSVKQIKQTFKITASLQDARELCDRKSSETARVLGSHEWTMWLT